jgi:hypothetical protein
MMTAKWSIIIVFLIAMSLSESIMLSLFNQSYAIEPEDVLAIWLFDEQKGNIVKDTSGNGHDGEIKGSPKWIDGKFGGGMEFPEKAENYVNVPHDDNLNLTTFTVTYWGKLHKTATWQIPVTKSNAATSLRNFDFQIPGGGGTVSVYFTQGASQWKGASAKTVVSDEQWHHVAGAYDLKNLRIYVDGVMEGENTYKGSPDPVPDPLTIGGFIGGVDPVGGILDEIGIFNKALSDNDIKNIMTYGLEHFVLAIGTQGKLTTTWAKIKDIFE